MDTNYILSLTLIFKVKKRYVIAPLYSVSEQFFPSLEMTKMKTRTSQRKGKFTIIDFLEGELSSFKGVAPFLND
jgi:hypothetical protein